MRYSLGLVGPLDFKHLPYVTVESFLYEETTSGNLKTPE